MVVRAVRLLLLAVALGLIGCRDRDGNGDAGSNAETEFETVAAASEPEEAPWVSSTTVPLDHGGLSLDQSREIAICIYQLFKFVEWPPPPPGLENRAYVVGVVGSGIMFNLINGVLTNQTVGDHLLVVRRLAGGDVAGMGECDLLFCESLQYLKSPDLLRSLEGQPILTVSPDPRFGEQGGMIRMDFDRDKLMLAIYVQRARSARLQVSSKLLSVSKAIMGDP